MYASRAQQGLFHSPNSPVSPSIVKEFDRASKGHTHLPYHVHFKKPSNREKLAAHLAKGKHRGSY